MLRRLLLLAGACLLATLLLGCSGGADCTITDDIFGDCDNEAGIQYRVTLLVAGLDDHVGETMKVLVTRSVGGGTVLNLTRTVASNTESVDFFHRHEGIVQVWIDADGDGACDAPPADLAWRIEIDIQEPAAVYINRSTPTTATCP